jgi:hypothetical protein
VPPRDEVRSADAAAPVKVKIKGQGQKAATLNPKRADLTQLAKNNNGTFPTARVIKILDGSEAIPAHGSPQNPVWGHEFGAGENAARGNPQKTIARLSVEGISCVTASRRLRRTHPEYPKRAFYFVKSGIRQKRGLPCSQ